MLEGIVGFAAIIAVTAFITKFVLKAMHLPVMSDQEWEIQQCTRPNPHVCTVNGPCTALYFTDGGPKVVRTEFVLCRVCKAAEDALESTTRPA